MKGSEVPEIMLFSHIRQIAVELGKASEEHELFENIAARIREHYPETFIIITVITPKSNSYQIQVLKGVEKFRKNIEMLLGKDIFSIEFPLKEISEDNLRLNSNGKLNEVSGGVYALALESIPKSISYGVEKILGIEKVYTMGLVLDDLNFGNMTIFCKKGFEFKEPDVHFIETIGVIGTIALQKSRALRQGRADNEKIDRILQVAPIGIGIMRNRIFHDVNERICEITGYDKPYLIGQSARILYQDDAEFERVGSVKYSQLEEKGVGEVETVWVCKDGSLRNILLRSAALNQENFSDGVIFTALDITQRKEIGKALQESEERYRKLVENAPIAILIHRNGIIEYVNQTALKLLEADFPEQPIGKVALELVHPDDRDSAMERIKKMYQTGQQAPVAEERFITFQGHEMTLQVAANIIQFQGSPASFVFGLDISELKSAQNEIIRFSKELEEINLSKDKFFSIIAHDLKGPFNSILGFADILNTEYDEYTDDERKHFIRNIVSSSQNTYRLLENLLEWSRAQTNRIEYKPEVHELSLIVNESILMVRSQAEAKDIHLFSAVEFDVRVIVDENMTKTIVRNLLSNAIKFSRRRGNVRIMEKRITDPKEQREMIEILVKDDGIGMSQPILEQLFRIDQMIKTPGTDNEKGTGLGLILCRELVKRNGGDIWAESEPGKGTTIHFTLPSA